MDPETRLPSQPEPHTADAAAVLPFRQLRDDPDIGFLAFSVPDAVVHALSGLTSLVVRSSAVPSRLETSPVDLDAIAVKADVDAVLTGHPAAIRTADPHERPTPGCPERNGPLVGSLQVTLEEVFELQDRLVGHIVQLAVAVVDRARTATV